MQLHIRAGGPSPRSRDAAFQPSRVGLMPQSLPVVLRAFCTAARQLLYTRMSTPQQAASPAALGRPPETTHTEWQGERALRGTVKRPVKHPGRPAPALLPKTLRFLPCFQPGTIPCRPRSATEWLSVKHTLPAWGEVGSRSMQLLLHSDHHRLIRALALPLAVEPLLADLLVKG